MGGGGAGHTHAVDESAKVLHLGPKNQVAKLGIGEEDNEEHDSEAQDVLGTASQCGGELGHGLVEADVLEDLQGSWRNKRKGEKHGTLQGPMEVPDQTRKTRPTWGKVSESLGAEVGGKPRPGTLIQAKKTLTAFILLYCVCQKARNSKSA